MRRLVWKLETDADAVVNGMRWDGTGIGRATAIALGHAGWSVVITARRKEQLDETASQIKSCHTVVADLVHCDGLATSNG